MTVEIPPELRDPQVLLYLTRLLAAGSHWTEGDPLPDPPKTLTIPLPELMAKLEDPDVRRYVASRLAVLARPAVSRGTPRRKR